MNRTTLFGRLLRGTLVAGAVATSLTAGIAFAEQGKSQGSAHRADAATAAHGNPASPGSGSLAHRHGASGTIASVSGTSFVLNTKQGDLTITTDSNTTYHAREGATATFATLAKGQRVNVHGDRPNDTTLLAERINLRPAKAAKAAKSADAKAADVKVAGAVDAKDAKADKATKAAKRQNEAKGEKAEKASKADKGVGATS